MPSRLHRFVSMLVSASLVLTGSLPVTSALGQDTPSAASSNQASSGKTYSQQELDELLAPIALHPDALLAQILMASTYPLDVVEAARWKQANPKVEGKKLETAMEQQRWDPSVKSLSAFPNVLEMMNDKLDWTQKLGDAFLGQQAQVMDTVQSLRTKAKQAGSLETTKEQIVTTATEGSQTVIKVEPADPQVVYVPTYNPTTVYGPWWYSAPPPYYWYPPGYVPGAAFFTFTAGVIVGSWLWGGCNWGHGGGSVNININRYNQVNHYNKINNGNWQHNVENRRGVPYASEGSRQKYGDKSAQTRDTRAREEFRGRAESGRQELGQDFGRAPSTNDRSAGGTGHGAGVQDRSQGMDRGDRGERSPSAGTAERSGAFSGVEHGSQARDFSARGSNSRSLSGGSGAGRRGGGRR
ncbi:DUF3300 domain-containing protein [Uliginosibacterium sp. 31-12]|uniref:DUF3300 domain-containing protein n=1 Tax=Uliginosibacterium sp. 31-12 TaxID=3062781 RepID=UPI0026E373D2|nr:DUF3300 domain-containing protein [Uliginosibacterium sp. 31-12]MDO6385031.1 DUF3300 domain-containing protein [Uliginosibacterium sp. 31-12]